MKVFLSIVIFAFAFFCADAVEVQWSRGSGLENWKALYRLKCAPVSEGLRLHSIGSDSSIVCEGLKLNPQNLNAVEITYKAAGIRRRTHGQIYFANDRGRFSDARRWNLPSMSGSGQWQTMRITSAALTDPDAWFKGGTVTKLRLDMEDEPGGEILISKIRFFHDPNVRPAKSMTSQLDGPVWPAVKPDFYPLKTKELHSVPYFSTGMVSHPRDNGRPADYYVRRSFVLPGKPEYALLQCSADDRATFYLNGKKAAFAPTWDKTISADVTGLLREGDNVLAIEYHNDRGAGGVLAEIQMRLADGQILKTGTDSEAIVSDRKSAGWNEPGFDDSDFVPAAWNPPPPGIPWTRQLDYRDISTTLRLLNVSLDRAAYSAGDTVKMTVQVKGKCPALPSGVMLHPATGAGLLLPPEEIRLTDENVQKISPDEWSFTIEYPLPRNLRDCRFRLEVKTAWQIDRNPAAELDYAGIAADPEKHPNITTEVRQTPQGPRFFLNGKMVYPAIACVPRNSGPDPMELDFRLLFPVGDWWLSKDKYDFSAFDLAVEQAFQAYPNVKFFVQLSTHPPVSWAEEHPNEMARTEDGRISRHLGIGETPHSFSSKIALEDKRKAVTACVKYLENSPYADRIAGYRIIGGHTAEWIGWGHMDKWLFDYSKPAQKAFVEYARISYPEAHIQGIPSVQQRLKRPNGTESLLDSKENTAEIAYNRFYSVAIADMLIDLCRTAKKACGGRKAVGSYYGYTFNTSGSIYFQGTGHYDLMRVLESGAVDFLMSPQSYGIRHLGETMGDMKPFQTIANHGILSIVENDMRTHALPPIWTNNYDQTLNAAQSVSIMGRDLGIALCRLQPLLLYTFYGKYHSEFSFPEMRPLMRDLRRTGEFCLKQKISRKADIALVVSEQSLNYLALEKRYVRTGGRRQNYNHTGAVGNFPTSALHLTGELISGQIDPVSRSGAVCDYVLAEDIANHLDDYRLWIFTDCFEYDEAFLAAVRKLRKRPVTLLWLYAPGYYRNGVNTLENMQTLTGFQFRKLASAPAEIQLADKSYLGIENEVSSPAFCIPAQPGVRLLGNYTGTPFCGFAEKQDGPSRSIFCGAYRFSAAFYRRLAAESGAHIYSDSGDPVEANEGLVTLHARWPGRKTIRLKQRSSVVDVYNHRLIADDADSFSFDAPLHSSWLFYIGPDAEKLLKELKD